MIVKGLFLLLTTFTSTSATSALVTDLRHSYKIHTSAKTVAQALKSQFGYREHPLVVIYPSATPVDVTTITAYLQLAL